MKCLFRCALVVVFISVSMLSGQSTMQILNFSEHVDARAIQTVGGTWDKYHSYNSTNSLTMELFNLSAQHPDIMKVISIGKTWKGRDIWAVKISQNVNVDDPNKPEVIFDGNHHAREWLTVEVCMYIIHKFVDEYGTNATITNLVNTRQIWVIPTMNPDGRVYDGGGNDGIDPNNVKNWRKNLRDNNNNGQIDTYDGVDLNRNYDIGYGVGSSTSQSSDTYQGPAPFSEKETQAYRDFAKQHHFITGITYHSYAQLILYPWAYTSAHTSDNTYFTSAASKIKSLIKNNAGSAYSWQTGQPPEILYAAGGSTFDHLYYYYGTFQFCIELYPSQSDSISDGFHPPTSKILPACMDQIEAVVFMVESAKNPYYILGNSDDVGVYKIEPFTNMTNYSAGTHSINAYIENFGKNAQSGFNVSITISKVNGSSAVQVYANTRTVSNTLTQNQTEVLNWTYNFQEAGTYNIKVETLKSDSYSANNKKEIRINITGSSGDTTPPVISNVAASGITASGATITWTTDEASSSVVEYGTTTSYGQSATGASGVTSHSVTLSGLSASTTYHFRVKSADAAGNTATSSDYTFITSANASDVISLTDGVATTGSLSTAKDAKNYSLVVPAGKSQLKVELTGPSGTDFDLYAKLGAKPTTSTYDYRSIGSTSTETITVTNPSAGTWYFMVYSYSGSGTFTIKATTSTSQTNVTQLTDGVSATGTLSKTGAGANYSIAVSEGKAQLKIEMNGPAGTDFDVYVKFGTMATRTSYDYKGTSSSSSETITISNPNQGTWYIYVYSYSGSGDFTIKATTYNTTTQDFSMLISGVSKNGTLAQGQKIIFYISVPADTSQLKIELVGATNTDFDLYIKLNTNPSTSSYDYRSVSSSSTETITINNPATGVWYIMVYAYAGSGDFTIKATYSG